MYACTGGMLEAEHVDLRAHVEQEREPRVVADLGGEVQQRRAALGDAVDVDDRLLEQDLQHAHAIHVRDVHDACMGGMCDCWSRTWRTGRWPWWRATSRAERLEASHLWMHATEV